ncbi:uncharacterized protein LOC110455971 [Mizuhopecten yessoensis]|uniref:Uncharacterized protein n=1 Tax=Mizuhopecten yessoensis TaxID=6573 RepID=A0A210QC05_MIZYE|nr:uncharacterized protein LOC110455971 [Mizuhopecten yessoensis]OWF46264.1 hypothetical protein KP79_PYT13006 [Mizuhopecten yessoensis]
MSSSERVYSVNLEKIINDYTWNRFRKTKHLLRRPFCRKSNYYIDINWGYADFKHDTVRFDIRPYSTIALPGEIATGSAEASPSKQQGVDKDGNKNVVLYKSKYENRTPLDQQYTFTTTRETKASCNVEFQETYTKGAECNIEIKVPGDIVTIGAGLSGELSVTKTKSETFEETITWEVNTQINVAKGHTAEATVVVSERNSMADFEVKSTMSLPDGKDMPVSVRRISDDAIVYTDIINDLAPVFSEVAKENPNVELVKWKDQKRGMLRSNVILTTHGTCKSVSWKNQNVHVNSTAIVNEDPDSTLAEDGDET